MDEHIHLGQIAGIRVGANWSLLVAFWLITWSLADGQLPLASPGSTTGAYWTAGLVAGVVFYACLLAHEMSHAILARRAGVGVSGIVLWLFGGVSRLERDMDDPSAEFRVAIAGPVTSLTLGGLFFGASVLLNRAQGGTHPSLVAATVGWLGWINLLLGGFNLMPAFPLDGGRVLRAFLWRQWNDRLRATLTAARAGRAFGFGLVGLGLFAAFSGGGVSGLWFVFLGWFLLSAANAEGSAALMEGRLGGRLVAEVMTADPIVAPATATVATLLNDYLYRNRCSTFPIVDGAGQVTGLVTLARVKRVDPTEHTSLTLDRIAAPMAEVVTCAPRDNLVQVVERMNGNLDQRALVFDGPRLVGIVSPSDVTRALEMAELASGWTSAR